MEVRVRNVDPFAVKKIDELAKQKGLSRQEFLRRHLENFAAFTEESKRENELKNLIEKNIFIMKQCSLTMDRMDQTINDLTDDLDE